MSSSDKIIDKLSMPASAMDTLAQAVPTDVVRAIVSDPAPTPPLAKSIVDQLVEKFGPKAD